MADRIKNYQQEADQITTLKAIRTDLGVTPSSYTPDATVVTKDRVVTYAQAKEELVVLSDIEKGVKQQVAEVDIAQKDIANIKALLQGHLYDYQTDSTSAYIKSVPSGAMPYAGLEKVGGKTVVLNQLVQNGNFENTNGWYYPNGIATKTASNNVLTVTFTGSTNHHINKLGLPFVSGHKYYVCSTMQSSDITTAQISATVSGGSASDVVSGVDISAKNIVAGIFTSSYTTSNGIIWITFGGIEESTGTGTIENVMIVDLTLAFGSGNEPSTAEELTAILPADYYEFNEGTLLSAGVTEVVSKDSNNATLQTIPIPTAIRNLEGYGWSAGDAYNYIDYERKVFVKNVGRVVLDGTQSIAYPNYKPLFDSVAWLYNRNVANPSQKNAPNDNTKSNVVASKLITRTFNECENYNGNFISAMNPDYYSFIVRYMDTSLTTTEAINAFLSSNPITVYYELLNPIEIDISEYLTDDNLINVEAGGTLTFPNSNGTDYQIPVPSEEEYMIDLQSAIGG